MIRVQGIAIVLLAANLTSFGQGALTNSPRSFAAGSYSQYQRQVMTEEERAVAVRRGPQFIDGLIRGLLDPIPEYAEWLRRGCINTNTNKTSAETLHRFADNYIPFTREHIDGLIKGLDHPDPSVVQEVRNTLTQTFGIWFVEGEDWVYKNEDIRRPRKEAWRKFWRQNRERYGKDLPLVINDLSLDAKIETTNSEQLITITISNAGGVDWRIYTEVAGALEPGKHPEPGEWEWPYTLLVNDHEENPVIPAAYYLTPCVMLPSEHAAPPDRPAHIDRVLIPAGQTYTYTMNATQSFPRVNFLTTTNVIVRYKYGVWNTHTNEPLWRGELRSLPIRVMESKAKAESNQQIHPIAGKPGSG